MARRTYTQSEGAVVEDRIESAALGRGNHRGYEGKVNQIVAYIRHQAKEYGNDPTKVPCPDSHQWEVLAHQLLLPPGVVLGIYASEAMQGRASRGDFRQLFFNVAMARITEV